MFTMRHRRSVLLKLGCTFAVLERARWLNQKKMSDPGVLFVYLWVTEYHLNFPFGRSKILVGYLLKTGKQIRLKNPNESADFQTVERTCNKLHDRKKCFEHQAISLTLKGIPCRISGKGGAPFFAPHNKNLRMCWKSTRDNILHMYRQHLYLKLTIFEPPTCLWRQFDYPLKTSRNDPKNLSLRMCKFTGHDILHLHRLHLSDTFHIWASPCI